ncbi:MAG: hypothetical protein COA78_22130 [Blastopirellula sp.]|nr:MAG: hypothetical protein COA78_22130 [Blastopirellula sp.]
MTKVSYRRLREIISYDKSSGLLTSISSRGNLCIGDVVGYTHSSGYNLVKVDGKLYKAHRLAFLYVEGNFPPNAVDHINGIRDDNRWCNLRHATNSQNQANRKIGRNNTSGYKGVCWGKYAKKWAVNIYISGKRKHVGYYKCKHKAAKAYNKAALKYHGYFAVLNEVVK